MIIGNYIQLRRILKNSPKSYRTMDDFIEDFGEIIQIFDDILTFNRKPEQLSASEKHKMTLPLIVHISFMNFSSVQNRFLVFSCDVRP